MNEGRQFTPRRPFGTRNSRLPRTAGWTGTTPLPVIRPHRRTRFAAQAIAALIVVGGLAAWQPLSRLAWDAIDDASAPAATTALLSTHTIRFGFCARRTDTDCVVDGDTVRFDGMIVRIADIDTPETRDYACPDEKVRGDAATRRLRDLLSAGPFEVRRYERDEDVYGRKLRILTRDGASIGGMLVAEGLARPWDGARRPWC